LRCAKCGNENPDGNRFCGMCGATLIAKNPAIASAVNRAASNAVPIARPTPAQPTSAQPASPTQQYPPVQTRTSSAPNAGMQVVGNRPTETHPSDFHPRPDSDKVITGPSFLGLNNPNPRRSDPETPGFTRSAEDPLRSSANLDYLLDDDEPASRGPGKIILILVALALAGGFGYLRWKQGGFDWLTTNNQKPSAAQPASDSPQNANNNDNGAAGTNTPSATSPAPTGTTAAPNPSATPPAPAPSPTTTGTVPATNAVTAPSAPQAAPAPNPPQGPPQTSASPNNSSAPQITPLPTTSPDSANSAPEASAPDNPSSDSSAQPSTPDQPAAKPAPPAASKPSPPKPSPARPSDSVAEAERYMYGRGVPKDCDHGLRLLKSAADHSDAKAMVSLGAIYSTGANCAPRDLPTAYRWFALALHKQPNDQALQDDLQKLWGQMTQPERQLAIKLSQ
jgi:hypothetical protein